jgi:putative phage-type endonuclease
MTTFTTIDRINSESITISGEGAEFSFEPIPFAGMVDLKIKQGTEEWHQIRLGKVTASRVADVMSKVKSGESAGRKNYKMDLVVERLTNSSTSSFSSPAMQWGTETEPLARMAYEAFTGVFVDQVAFCNHPTIKNFGCSPDGVVGDGLIEIKCPNTTTHIEYLMGETPPAKYVPQMQTQMACTGARWCDFVSFDPRLPPELQLVVIRLNRDDVYIQEIETEVKQFLDEVQQIYSQLKARM